MTYDLHPLCTLFPRMNDAEFAVLRNDIGVNGLRQPITLHENLILDGGNRYRACLEAGVKPSFVRFSGESIGEFVRSANLHRRHLTTSQQAAIVATIQDWTKAQPHGGSSAPKSTPDTTRSRAEKSGASVSTQRRADAVAKAAPEVAVQVAQGKKTLAAAVKEVAPQLSSAGKPRVEPEQFSPAVASLQAELYEARQVCRNLAVELESYDNASGDVKEAAKEMARLKGQLATVETQRDQWMTTCNELRKEVKSLQRKLGRVK